MEHEIFLALNGHEDRIKKLEQDFEELVEELKNYLGKKGKTKPKIIDDEELEEEPKPKKSLKKNRLG